MKTYRISEARAKLFDLVDYVTGEEDGIVLIEHRDKEERAALVAEAHLKALYRTIEELRARGGEPFQLEGSMAVIGTEDELDEAIRAVRQDWSRLSTRDL